MPGNPDPLTTFGQARWEKHGEHKPSDHLRHMAKHSVSTHMTDVQTIHGSTRERRRRRRRRKKNQMKRQRKRKSTKKSKINPTQWKRKIKRKRQMKEKGTNKVQDTDKDQDEDEDEDARRARRPSHGSRSMLKRQSLWKKPRDRLSEKYVLIMDEQWQKLPTICTGVGCSRDQVSERTTKNTEAGKHLRGPTFPNPLRSTA